MAIDLVDTTGIANLLSEHKLNQISHLPALARVRYYVDNPLAYADSNLVGHLTIQRGGRHVNTINL
ncbi:GDP-mannose 4,6-dehydratase [Shewanella sp. 10N.286.52.C2]|uniref:GDP-mannose 4,6-dehydratase n=1 Tax=Shewanella sp. 10N.286.52.C2 TaxID=1880838 RepID=UPI000C83F4DC|nr:GDP-mannose 4,6-dehydratase [Shewanella sp. 10N.286.52.C2]